MKKELLIVILMVIAIIGVSALLKYVIFADYAGSRNAESKNICEELCKKEKFSVGRCGYNNCSEKEKEITSTEKNFEKIQEFCDSRFKTKPVVSTTWICCCR